MHWQEIAHNLEEATTLTFPRYFFRNSDEAPTTALLLVFEYARPKAHGAVSYITRGSLKSRVAPLKKLTSPRVELMATVTGADLASFISTTGTLT